MAIKFLLAKMPGTSDGRPWAGISEPQNRSKSAVIWAEKETYRKRKRGDYYLSWHYRIPAQTNGFYKEEKRRNPTPNGEDKESSYRVEPFVLKRSVGQTHLGTISRQNQYRFSVFTHWRQIPVSRESLLLVQGTKGTSLKRSSLNSSTDTFYIRPLEKYFLPVFSTFQKRFSPCHLKFGKIQSFIELHNNNIGS